MWERFEPRPRDEPANALNHPAAVSPVTDGENVYSFFKDFGLVSYDAAGNPRWKAPMGPFSNAMGQGGSPILAGDSVVYLADQLENSYIAAYDRRNGELRWKTTREESEGWGTPVLYQAPGMAPVILTASRGVIGAHRVSDGRRTMSQHGISPTIVGSPVLEGDLYFVFGYGSEAATPFSARLEKLDKNHDGRLTPDEYKGDAFMLSVGRFGGNRDLVVTQDEWDERQREVIGFNGLVAYQLERGAGGLHPRELWRYQRSFTGVIPSALLYQGILYIVKNGAILTSFDARTGRVLKTGRIPGALGGYSSSPVVAEGRIYIASEDGKLAVLRAVGDWELLALNDLGETCFATPALADGAIYLRTGEALYRFGSLTR